MKIGDFVSATLTNGFWFNGRVLQFDDSHIVIRDSKGEKVTLLRDAILTLREVNSA